MENRSKLLPIIFLPGITTGALVSLFLSGKIIDIPHGTTKGGIIAGTGVLVIMISVFAIYYLIFRLFGIKRKNALK
jgi:hypothetical protein